MYESEEELIEEFSYTLEDTRCQLFANNTHEFILRILILKELPICDDMHWYILGMLSWYDVLPRHLHTYIDEL